MAKFFDIPDDIFGYLEWSTGIIFLNLTADEYIQSINSESIKSAIVKETIYHETYHYLQIVSSGFLYNTTRDFSNEVLGIITAFINDICIPSKCKTFRDALIMFNENVDLTTYKIGTEHFSKLDLINIFKFSTRDIIEGGAYLLQKQMTNIELTHEIFLSKLKFAPSKTYSKVYKFVTLHLGELAFSVFHSIAYFSLLFAEPEKIFPHIVFDYLKPPDIKRNVLKELQKQGNVVLGTPIEMFNVYHNELQEFDYFYGNNIIEIHKHFHPMPLRMTKPQNFIQIFINNYNMIYFLNDGHFANPHQECHVTNEIFDYRKLKTMLYATTALNIDTKKDKLFLKMTRENVA